MSPHWTSFFVLAIYNICLIGVILTGAWCRPLYYFYIKVRITPSDHLSSRTYCTEYTYCT